jgi:hypothetical protein
MFGTCFVELYNASHIKYKGGENHGIIKMESGNRFNPRFG